MLDDQPVTLWTLRRDNEEIACRIRLVPYGIEVDMLNRGSLVLTRVFATDTEAMEWAEERRSRRQNEGWEPVPVETVAHSNRPA